MEGFKDSLETRKRRGEEPKGRTNLTETYMHKACTTKTQPRADIILRMRE